MNGTTGNPAKTPEPSDPRGVGGASGIADVRALIPHRNAMLLIDAVVASDGVGQGQVAATLRADAPYFRGGRFASHWCVELMAQAVGAIFSLQLTAPDADPAHARDAALPPKLGYLVAVDDFKFFPGAALQPGAGAVIDVAMVHSFYPIGQYTARLSVDGVERASATMKFMTDDARDARAGREAVNARAEATA